MNCQGNVNSTLPTQLPHKFSYIVAILGHNHFESPNILRYFISVFVILYDGVVVYLSFEDVFSYLEAVLSSQCVGKG
jgi:hypothetical protein